MTKETIQRYQPGGDIYAKLEDQHGRNGALLVARAAMSGENSAVNDALTRVKYGEKLDDSTASNLWSQLTTDPFGAPLESANKTLGTLGSSAIIGIFKNPWVLFVVVVLVFHAMGGFQMLAKKWRLG